MTLRGDAFGSREEFHQAIERYIAWASEWDGSLPAGIFLWRAGRYDNEFKD